MAIGKAFNFILLLCWVNRVRDTKLIPGFREGQLNIYRIPMAVGMRFF